MATLYAYPSLRCNPTPEKQFTTAKKVHRHVMCQDYGACLDRAVKQGWSGFSCDECTAYRLEEGGDPAYWQVQNERAAEILNKVLTDKEGATVWL
ncbi:MAG: hypothetical protein ABSG35_15960 [Syntrophobacteraceae bacterium]|jgi:hypothetical protein